MNLRKLRDLRIIENFIDSKVVLHGGKFYLEQKFYVNPDKLATYIAKMISESSYSYEAGRAPFCKLVECAFNSGTHCKDIIGKIPSCRNMYQSQSSIMTRYSSLNTLFIISKLRNKFII